jgi:ATP-dependent DNA helicase PIF1
MSFIYDDEWAEDVLNETTTLPPIVLPVPNTTTSTSIPQANATIPNEVIDLVDDDDDATADTNDKDDDSDDSSTVVDGRTTESQSPEDGLGIPLAPEPWETRALNLSEAQYKTISLLLQRKSVFFTGAAGTGKSFIVQILKDVLRYLGLEEKIAFTAPTGVAACNIGGVTIHSWSGVGIASEPLTKLVSKVRGSGKAKMRWRRTEILVIDEISMLSDELFDIICEIGSKYSISYLLPYVILLPSTYIVCNCNM